MSFFSVAPSVGSYRTTLHPYKLVFQMNTKVQTAESVLIPTFGVSLSKIADVCGHDVEYDYLVGNDLLIYTIFFCIQFFFCYLMVFCSISFYAFRCYWNDDCYIPGKGVC